MTEGGLKEREERGYHCQSTATKANKAGDKSHDQSHTHAHCSLAIGILSSNPLNDRSLIQRFAPSKRLNDRSLRRCEWRNMKMNEKVK